MAWRLLEETELYFAALYFCETTASRDKVLLFGRSFPRCLGSAWWSNESAQMMILLFFDTAIPVNDCARFWPDEVVSSLFYVPPKDCLKSATSVEFERFDQFVF